ncbi:hypothetical protein KOI40_14100 [Aestuariicella sp. G3-2]|uniref:subtilisin-like serine protease QhpE n=1 Tax=Pseudomaricurvus albidus TaxID=2842452 RepID=UPI001C0D9C3C|nr:S8 family serine peptidase [Aestuariicella albida]MBU3070952.1 hypothetical protein [Aestuariicella albida]
MVKIGVLDSGVAPELESKVVQSHSFVMGADHSPADILGHGSLISRVINQQSDDIQFVIGKIFDRRPVTTAQTVSDGIDWLVQQGVQVINLSLGLPHDRECLKYAVEAAAQEGVVVVASSPARGKGVFPASYPRVISVTADIRCRPGEFSFLGTPQAEFGACAYLCRDSQDFRQEGGASIAAAYVSGSLARYLVEGVPVRQVVHHFSERCQYQGKALHPVPRL